MVGSRRGCLYIPLQMDRDTGSGGAIMHGSSRNVVRVQLAIPAEDLPEAITLWPGSARSASGTIGFDFKGLSIACRGLIEGDWLLLGPPATIACHGLAESAVQESVRGNNPLGELPEACLLSPFHLQEK